jgi:hypothetical protein
VPLLAGSPWRWTERQAGADSEGLSIEKRGGGRSVAALVAHHQQQTSYVIQTIVLSELVELISLLFNPRMRTDGHAPWAMMPVRMSQTRICRHRRGILIRTHP